MAAILVICGLAVLTSCSREDDPVESDRQEYTGVPLVILDTDLGSSTDDLFTLSPRGRVTLTPQAETIFTPSATGRSQGENCRYQLPGTTAWNAAMLEKIRRYNKIK